MVVQNENKNKQKDTRKNIVNTKKKNVNNDKTKKVRRGLRKDFWKQCCQFSK